MDTVPFNDRESPMKKRERRRENVYAVNSIISRPHFLSTPCEAKLIINYIL